MNIYMNVSLTSASLVPEGSRFRSFNPVNLND